MRTQEGPSLKFDGLGVRPARAVRAVRR